MRTTALRHLAYSTALVIFSLTLTACGGSSSGPGPITSSAPESSSSEASSESSSESNSSVSSSSSSSVADTTPDSFSFTPLENQALEAEVTSDPVPITGITDPAEVTIENGQYAIDDGAYTAEASQIDENQTLTLKTTTPASAGATKEVTVTVGGVAGVWTVSTPEDTEPPEAAFVFPTPMTATEAPTVIVRGTATDELSTVTRVTLQVESDGSTSDLDLESENDFATWQKEVPLTEGSNTITISAEDEFGNELTDGESVTVVRQAIEEPFPDGDLPIRGPQKLVYDEARGRVLMASGAETLVYSIDINTGKRSSFFTEDMASELTSIDNAMGLEITPGGEQLLVLLEILDGEGPGVVRIDLDAKEYEVLLTRDSQPDGQPNFSRPTSIRLDPTNPDRAFGLDSGGKRLLSLDLATGARTLVSNNDAEFSGPFMSTPNDLLIDSDNNRALVADRYYSDTGQSLYWVDLMTGDRTLLLSEGVPEGFPATRIPSIATADIGQRVFGVEWVSHSLWSVDTATGQHTVISGPEQPHGFNELGAVDGVALSESNEYLIGVDSTLNGVFVIDLKTGERLILSKN